MFNYYRDDTVVDISRKLDMCLTNGLLEVDEVGLLKKALCEYKGNFVEPYAEIVYHDRYGNERTYVIPPESITLDMYGERTTRFTMQIIDNPT